MATIHGGPLKREIPYAGKKITCMLTIIMPAQWQFKELRVSVILHVNRHWAGMMIVNVQYSLISSVSQLLNRIRIKRGLYSTLCQIELSRVPNFEFLCETPLISTLLCTVIVSEIKFCILFNSIWYSIYF